MIFFLRCAIVFPNGEFFFLSFFFSTNWPHSRTDVELISKRNSSAYRLCFAKWKMWSCLAVDECKRARGINIKRKWIILRRRMEKKKGKWFSKCIVLWILDICLHQINIKCVGTWTMPIKNQKFNIYFVLFFICSTILDTPW